MIIVCLTHYVFGLCKDSWECHYACDSASIERVRRHLAKAVSS